MAILKSKSGTSYDTETGIRTNADGTTIKVNNVQGGTTTPMTPSPVINAEMLKNPANKINLPTPTTLNTNALTGSINASVANAKVQSQAEAEKQAFLEKNKTESTNIANLMSSLVAEEKKKTFEAQTEAGVYDAKKAYDEYVSQIEAEEVSLRRKTDEMRKNAGGLGVNALNAQIYDTERASLSKQADLAILQNASVRRYDTAMQIAKDKVEIELAPRKAQLEGLKFIYDNNKQFQTAEFNSLLNRKEKELDQEQKIKDTIAGYTINALRNNAPLAMRDAISKAKTLEELNKIPGVQNYITSPEDKLDLKLKQAQISKIYSDLNAPKEETAQQYKERTEKEKKEATKQAQIPIVKEKIDLVNKLLTHKGLNTRVGPSALGLPTRTTFGIRDAFGEGTDFAATVQQLTNQDTLNQLLELKAAGGTLGAVSEKELDLLQKAASKINAWEVKDKNGIGKGQWNISEKKFKDELNTVLKSSQALYESLGGDGYNQEQLSGYLDIVDGALQSSENVYSQGGYDL